jgi:transcriptional regulator with XRE-family HTH domain
MPRDMNVSARTQLLEALLASGMKQAEIAKALGTTQPNISRWLKGKVPKLDVDDALMELALAHGLLPEGHGFVTLSRRNVSATVQIVGYVGAGAAIIFDQEGDVPLGEAPRPMGAGATTVAVRVRGESMPGSAEDGWLIYYDSRQDPVTEGLMGKLCVVGCTDGRVLVKKLYRGRSEGLFDLAPTIGSIEKDVAVRWAARVEWIKPSHA